MNETPACFIELPDRTLAKKSAHTVTLHLSDGHSGWNKRQLIIVLCACADSVQRVKPLIIFHGTEDAFNHKTGFNKTEEIKWDKRIKVTVNEAAWINEKLMIE